ncbi:MAG: SRPBCC domain-containing protein [Caulobacter sp.]|nr:SRPBCC domain-containing protein [Caulobacter sp.]
MTRPIVSEAHVDLPPDEAFARFVDGLGRWWPMAYTYSGARFETARVEPRVGGQWGEVTRDGETLPWGDVRVFEPGRRVVLGFNIAADRSAEPPERWSEVEIAFAPDNAGTRIRLEHRDLDRHGDGAQAIADGMASDQGWPLILASFRRETRRPR